MERIRRDTRGSGRYRAIYCLPCKACWTACVGYVVGLSKTSSEDDNDDDNEEEEDYNPCFCCSNEGKPPPTERSVEPCHPPIGS